VKRSNSRGAAKPQRNGNRVAARNGAPVSQADQFRLKVGLAEMLKGGVIMDVMNAEQAEIAQEAGASAVMALERIPSRIRRDGGVARMSDPTMIQRIQSVVDIPVMAKIRIGHIVEAVRHMRAGVSHLKLLPTLAGGELMADFDGDRRRGTPADRLRPA